MPSQKKTRRPVRKPKRSPVSAKKRKPVRRAVKKKKKEFNPDRVELTTIDKREALRFKKTLNSIITPLEQLKEKIESDLEAIKKAEKPIHFLRAMRGVVYGAPHLVWCKHKGHQSDLVICAFVCKGQCTNFNEKRFICKMFRCSDEKIYQCNSEGKHCDAFRAYQNFPMAYIRAYQPLYRMTTELHKLENPSVPIKKRRKRRKRK